MFLADSHPPPHRTDPGVVERMAQFGLVLDAWDMLVLLGMDGDDDEGMDNARFLAPAAGGAYYDMRQTAREEEEEEVDDDVIPDLIGFGAALLVEQ